AGRLTQGAEAPSCAAFARGPRGDGTFVIPSGLSTATLEGSPFALEAVIGAYRGPGAYTEADFGEPTTTTLTVDLTSAQSPFEPVGEGASESARINADGSGSFTFNDWQDAAMRTEGGTITWTCHTRSP
ncbi:MAG TPA: hypothetical protein VJU79_08260, partial [Candidatus Dormibacteraeota bacterium]|nr:hypothetical protein [Candidatus Dormibacteraeota bacterium]